MSKRPVGRPKGSALFTQQLHLYLEPKTFEMLKQQAQAAMMNISAYIRYLIHKGDSK